MIFDYTELLSGYPVYVESVGLVRSPKVGEVVSKQTGIGNEKYHFYLNLLSWNKESILQYLSIVGSRVPDRLRNEKFQVFDIISLFPHLIQLYGEMFSFFVCSEFSWNEEKRSYIFEDEENKIDRQNFEFVRKCILQCNYIGIDDNPTLETKHSSDQSKELWERCQKYLSEQSQKTVEKNNGEYHLGNIISKLCVVHPTYNLLNIFNLTVFQLYDAFFQYGYIRSAALTERIFSNHGGDKFKFEDWLKPILKNI